jgi:hypothetical protein
MVTFSVASHLGGFDLEYSQLEETERLKILEDSCDIIEKKLADMKYLSEFTWAGKQAFYNDESNESWSFKAAAPDYHLADNFTVWLTEGATNFEITNSKEVYSSKGKYNLFELLWYGFGPWRANKTYHMIDPIKKAYYMRTKKMRTKMWAMNGPMIEADVRISFYYRYASQWFYKLTERKGMDSSLVTKFHTYIDRAISRSIEEAIALNTTEDTYELMRGTA